MVRSTSICLMLSLALAIPASSQGPAQTPNQNPVLGPAGGRGQGRGPATPPPSGVPPAERNAGGRPFHNEAERAAKWKVVAMPYSRAGLTTAEQQMIAKLADACHLLDEIYLHQSDLGGWAIYHATSNADMYRLFSINGSRWAWADRNTPVIGEEPLVPGHELYPFGTTSAVIETYAAAHPEQKAASTIHGRWSIGSARPCAHTEPAGRERCRSPVHLSRIMRPMPSG